jgi:hypothetical protein
MAPITFELKGSFRTSQSLTPDIDTTHYLMVARAS